MSPQVRAWLESDRNPAFKDSDTGGAGPREMLADYLATRDPQSWDAFKARVAETDSQHTTRLRRYANEGEARAVAKAMPDGLMDELTSRSQDMQGSPIDLATMALPLLRGGKALQAARGGANAWKTVGKGALLEGGQEAGTEYLSDPNASAGQVLEAGALGVVGQGAMSTAGAATGYGMRKLRGKNYDGTSPNEEAATAAQDQPAGTNGAVQPMAATAAGAGNETGQDEQQREGTLPPPTAEQLNRPPVEVMPVPEQAAETLNADLVKGLSGLPAALRKKSEGILAAKVPDAEAFLNDYGEKHGHVIDADLMREMLRSPEHEGADFTKATDPLVAALSREASRRAIDVMPVGGLVKFLTGGPASGKSHVRAQLPSMTQDADVLIDAPMATHANGKALIDQALAKGGRVEINYIHTPVEKAARLMLNRYEKEGRETNAEKLADMHHRAQRTVLRLAQEYAGNPNVKIHVLDNSGEAAKPITAAALGARAYGSLDDARGRVHTQIDHELDQRKSNPFWTAERRAAVRGGSEVRRGVGSVSPADLPSAEHAAAGENDSIERALEHAGEDRGAVQGKREGTRGDGAGGAPSQAEQLAAAAGVPLMTDESLVGQRQLEGGNEHDVYVDPRDTSRVLKVTLPNFGLRKGVRVPAGTVERYLKRWQLSNQVLGDEARLVGVMDAAKGMKLVMSQPLVMAADAEALHPEVKEINAWLRAGGFEYQSGAWFREADGVTITDTHPGNFIKTGEGIRPIDVVVERQSDAQGSVIPWAETLQRLRAAGLETTPKSEAAAAFNMDAPNSTSNGGPGASSLNEWGKTTFGQRLKMDDRLRKSWRDTVGGNYRVESEAEWQQRANDFIEREGAEGAYGLMADPESGLADSDRVAIGLQLILHLDEQIKQTQLAGGDIMALDDLLYETSEWIEHKGTKLGQAVRVFGMWTRMSAEGVLRTFQRKVNESREADAKIKLGEDPQKVADEVSATAKEETENVTAEALGETTADQLTELQQQVAALRQQLAQANAEASAAQQEATQATTPADAAQAQKRSQDAEKQRQRAQRDLASAEARQKRKAQEAGKPRPPGQKKPKRLNPAELAARLIERLAQRQGGTAQPAGQATKNQVQKLADDYTAGRIDGPALQAALQTLGIDEAQADRLSELLDNERALRESAAAERGQQRQAGALSRQAWDQIDRLTVRHSGGGLPNPQQATSALSQLIRDYVKADAASLPDFNTQARQIGLDPAEAVELQRLLDLERKAIAVIAQERAIARLVGQITPKLAMPSTRERMPRFLQKLMEAHELGALDRPEFLKAYAETFELPMMDGAMRQKIKTLIDAQKAAPEGYLKQEATTKLMGELAKFKGISAVDIGMAFWYANILSGLSTQGVNVWGNAVHLLLKTLTVGATHNPRETWHFIRGMYEGSKRGLHEAKGALVNGQIPYRGDLNFTQGQTLELLHSEDPKTWTGRFKNGLALGRFVFRALGAGDAVFYNTAREGRAWLEAARYAGTQEKLNGGAFSDYLAEQLNHGPTLWAQAVAQAKAELMPLGKADGFGNVDRRAWEILEAKRPAELNAKAQRFGLLTTFNQEPEGTMGAVAGAINDLHRWMSIPSPWGQIRILTPLIPFVNIVANVTSAALDYTPVGIHRGVTGRYTRHVLDRSQKDFDSWEARQRLASGVLGTLGAGMAFAWAYAMKGRDDDEVPFMIYGMGPGSKARRDQMPKGWKPYTFKIGDKYVSYAETPLSLVMAVAGGTLDELRYNPKAKEAGVTAAATYALATSPQALLKTGVLSSINDLFNLMEGQKSVSQVATRTVAGFIPAQGLLRDISELFHGDKIDDTTLAAALFKDVPIIREMVGEPALNIFGEPVKLDILQRLPIFKRIITEQGGDKDTLWLARRKLWLPGLDNQIEVGTYLTEQDKFRTKGSEWRTDRMRQFGRAAADVLTPDERYKLVKIAGGGIRQAVHEMQAMERAYPAMTREQLQESLNAKVVARRREAMRKVLGLAE